MAALPQTSLKKDVNFTERFLLICGILSSLLYVAADVLATLRYEGYSYTDQTWSELSAIGAPTRPLMVALVGIPYSVLVIGFGVGVWQSARGKRALRVVGGLLVGYGVVCLTAPFTPMHLREVLARGEETLTDTLHIIGASMDVLFLLLIIGFGAMAFGKRFRLYSIGTILVLLVFGALASLQAGQLAANQPTPWMGIEERINIYGTMLWVAVLAIGFLRAQSTAAQHNFSRSSDSKRLKPDRRPGNL